MRSDSVEPAAKFPAWFRYLPAVVSVLTFGAALLVLHRLGSDLTLPDVLAAFRSIPVAGVVAAIAFTAGSYLALVGHDLLALRYVGRTLPIPFVAATSFMAYALGHNVGLVSLSAAAVRYRMYSPAGLGGAEITVVSIFCALTFHLGAGVMSGISLIGEAGHAASLVHASPSVAIAAGGVLLALGAAWLGLTITRRDPIVFRGWSFALPSWRMTLAQVAVASVDLLFAGAAVYALLPADAAVSFPAFIALYVIAVTAGAISNVPGGLGVFESVFVLLLPAVPVSQLLGVLLAYRLIYYILPFGVAILLLVVHELWQQRHRVRLALHWTRRSLDFVVPQAMALLTFAAGFVLLLSGATPALEQRLGTLRHHVILPALEVSHLAGSLIGLGLLVLARGLNARLDAAWHLALWLLGAGIAASLLKGLDYEEASILAVILLLLLTTRQEFHRRAALFAEPLAPRWLAAMAIAVGASIWVGLLAHRAVPYRDELWWQFAFDASAPRMLRASLLAVVGLGALAALRLLQAPRPRAGIPSEHDLRRAVEIIAATGTTSANLALVGDKTLLFSGSGRGFVMYGISGRSWIAMGDPVAPQVEQAELVWQFRELCDREGSACVFYEVAADNLPLYVDAGLSLSKLGEEARVPLAGFSLDGSARSALRQVHRKAAREGASFRIASPGEVVTLLPRLQAVSDDWLRAKSVTEKGFSLGRFDPQYLARFPCGLVEVGGDIVAFANLWESRHAGECSIDLMRHSGAAPKGVMDYLFIELMLSAQARGFEWFNLGMAPLSGLGDRRLAPAWHKLGRLVYRYGEDFYNFEGLRHYKNKFQPQWRPRYLAAPGGLALARIVLDVTALISGGLRGTVSTGAARQVAVERSEGLTGP